jgi:hypothetical protein
VIRNPYCDPTIISGTNGGRRFVGAGPEEAGPSINEGQLIPRSTDYEDAFHISERHADFELRTTALTG